MHILPKITFNIVALNEEKRIQACLKAIQLQNYPKSKIEIIVMDSGSTDRTTEIAKNYGAKIYDNMAKLPEPGLAEGYKKATGDYVVFMAVDNIIFDKNWTRKMVQPFLDYQEEVFSSFSRVINDPHDNIWSKYLNEDTDPFNVFVFGNCSHPEKFKKAYQVKRHKHNYIIYNYSAYNYPLIALAQCTVLKKGLSRTSQSRHDDILPLIEIIKGGKKIAYVTNTGIRHYSLNGFRDYCRKFSNRIYNSIKTSSYNSREQYQPFTRKIKSYLFIVYSFSFILPVIHSVFWAIQKRRMYLLIHPLACIAVSYYILYNFIKIKLWER